MKRKLALIVICVALLLLLFVRNVKMRINQGDEQIHKNEAGVEGILREEAMKQLAFLNYTKTEMDSLKFTMKYSDINKKDSNALYINAVHEWGILGEQQEKAEFRPKDILTYGECLDIFGGLLNSFSDNGAAVNEKVLNDLSFPILKAKKEGGISKKEWIELYWLILDNFYSEEETRAYTNGIRIKDLFLIHMSKDENKESGQSDKKEGAVQRIITDDGSFDCVDLNVEPYLDEKVTVLLKGDHIVSIYEVLEETAVLENVWIIGNEGKNVEVFVNGITRTYTTENKLSEDIERVIGDLEIKQGRITKISIKPDVISSKVLVADKNYIELEDYGKLELESSYRIYKIYDELSMEVTNGILVGYKNTDFVISDGKICAALIKESIKAENIRVLIKTNGFEDLIHKTVKVTAAVPITMYYGKKEKTYEAGKTLTFSEDSKYLKNTRVRLETAGDDNKIKVLSVNRANGTPEYRGSIEIEKRKDGLTIINELPLEEYLYGVVPSEMPASYGVEALKVQAVCARSYAYNQLMENQYGSYGAHVDDSVSFQVYNNISETQESTLAVKETYGKVLEYNDKVISAYYFSTSSGHTSSADEVWMSNKPIEYLTGKLQTAGGKDEIDLTDEETFTKFIKDNTYETYDSGFAWYRWSVKISGEDVKRSIDKKLRSRYNANPKLILTLKDGEYVSAPVDTLGSIVDVRVGKRQTGGIVTEAVIKGTKNTVKVFTEYNIRTLLAPLYDDVIRQDGSKVSNISMLPSAFFYLDSKKEDGKLSELTITGGGYGHGVGMSQNGVKAMTELGKNYEEILEHYYKGIELGFIY